MSISGAGQGPDFGDDDDTVIELEPNDFDTPITMPRCQDCGRIVFFDSFEPVGSIIAQGLFSDNQCVRGDRWRWCCEIRQYVVKVPR